MTVRNPTFGTYRCWGSSFEHLADGRSADAEHRGHLRGAAVCGLLPGISSYCRPIKKRSPSAMSWWTRRLPFKPSR
jgi:hypothetical protein